MADTKITSLQPPQAGYSVVPATDVLPIVVIADPGMATSGSTRKVTVNQLLGAGGTATLASATITGALTVDTTTLVVNPSGYADRVGIGTASPNGPLDVQANTAGTAISIRGRVSANVGTLRWFQNNGTTETAAIDSYDTGFEIRTLTAVPSIFITNSTERYRIASDGVATWSNVGGSSGTAMTLNATGLAVGTASPTAKLDVLGSGDGELRLRAGSDAALIFSETAANKNWKLKPSGGDFQFQYSATAYNSGYSPLMILTATGNVGIGVTPSAWAATFKPVQIGSGTVSSAFVGQTNSPVARIITNAYYDGTNFVKVQNNTAGMYVLSNNQHEWHNAVTGTGTAAFVQAMTLDASGNLLVGTTTGSFRGQFAVASGADRNIFTAQVTGASNGLQVLWNHATTTLRIVVANLPTSSAGLATGTLWIDTAAGNTLKVA